MACALMLLASSRVGWSVLGIVKSGDTEWPTGRRQGYKSPRCGLVMVLGRGNVISLSSPSSRNAGSAERSEGNPEHTFSNRQRD